MAGSVSGVALAEISAGLVLCWSGIENQKVGASLQSLIRGKKLSPTPDATTVDTNVGGSGGGGGTTGTVTTTDSAIANDALKYGGAGYVWDGAPADGIGDWDCSSFCNWVIGHDLGLAIPGYAPGTYTGAVHGPNTVSWLAWTGCVTVGREQAQAGDLAIWQTHMGIVLAENTMISAQDEALGTGQSIITGAIPGELLFIRRLKAARGSGTAA